MFRMTHFVLAAVLVAVLGTGAFAQEDMDRQIADLKERIAKLEQRVADLEKKLTAAEAKPSAEEARAARRAMFEKRMAQDEKTYTRPQMVEAEKLYQVANKAFGPEARESLLKMIEKYPDLNRTGCAVLYLGQMSEGADREKFLKQAIEKHGDCMYGDGVVVGAYARFYLGQHYARSGEKAKAAQVFAELQKLYPDAIDHGGRPLGPMVEVIQKD